MPSVTRKDGIFSAVTNQPFTQPITPATAIATRKATKSEVAPLLNSAHIRTGVRPKSEPTDRSNSPAVIKSVMASAIKPSSTEKASRFDTFWTDRKAGLIAVKTTISTISRIAGPASGRAKRRLASEVDVTRGYPFAGGFGPARLSGNRMAVWEPYGGRCGRRARSGRADSLTCR